MFRVNNPFESWRPPTAREHERLAHDTADHVAPHVVDAVQRAARMHPDWRDLADDIDVAWDEQGPHVGVQHPERMGRAHQLEYGDLGQPMKPLLRTTMNRIQPHVARRAGEYVVHRLLGGGHDLD